MEKWFSSLKIIFLILSFIILSLGVMAINIDEGIVDKFNKNLLPKFKLNQEEKVVSSNIENLPKKEIIKNVEKNNNEEDFFENKFVKGYMIEFKTPALLEEFKGSSQEQLLLLSPEQLSKKSLEIKIKKKEIEKVHKNLLVKEGIERNKILGEYFYVFNGFAIGISKEKGDEIKKRNPQIIKAIHPIPLGKALLDETVGQVRASSAWNLRDSKNNPLTGKNIKIGVIDTGVDYTHPDISPNYLYLGFDFLNNDVDPMDDTNHGTPVAAIAAGNGLFRGVAPDAKIVAYKVLGQSGGGGHLALAAMERSVDPNEDGDLKDHLDVVSMSIAYGLDNPDNFLALAADRLMQAGIITVIAAGNYQQGPNPLKNTITTPGVSREAITVGNAKKVSQYVEDGGSWIVLSSSRGPVVWFANSIVQKINKPDLVAPGDACAARSLHTSGTGNCGNSPNHNTFGGTSGATPHVSGAAAILRQKYPQLATNRIKDLLISSARDLEEDVDAQGAGMLDVYKAATANLIITPNVISETVASDTNNLLSHLYFYNHQKTAVQITLTPARSNSRTVLGVLGRGGSAGNISSLGVSLSQTSFCLETGQQRDVNVNADLRNLGIGIHKSDLIIRTQKLQGRCGSNIVNSQTETVPIRIKKAYAFTVTTLAQNYFPRETKSVSYYLSYPGSENVEQLIRGFPYLGERTFYADRSEVDIIAIVDTGEGASNFITTYMGENAADLRINNHLIFKEANTQPLDSVAHMHMQNRNYNPAIYFNQIYKQSGQNDPFHFQRNVKSYPINRPIFNFVVDAAAQIGTRSYFNTNDQFVVIGAIEGFPSGMNWENTNEIGFFPFYSHQVTSRTTVTNNFNFPTFFQDRVIDLSMDHPINAYSNIDIGKVFFTNPILIFVVPDNFENKMFIEYSTRDRSKGLFIRRNDPNFLSSGGVKTFFDLSVETSLSQDSTNECVNEVYFSLRENGEWVNTYGIRGNAQLTNQPSNNINFLSSQSLIFPNGAGVFQIQTTIPDLSFSQNFNGNSIPYNGCFNRYLI
ncbi:MAG: S8 family serine peptidase [Candidatus Nanoarchaeia archaeon]